MRIWKNEDFVYANKQECFFQLVFMFHVSDHFQLSGTHSCMTEQAYQNRNRNFVNYFIDNTFLINIEVHRRNAQRVVSHWNYFGYRFGSLSWASYQMRNIAGCACAGNAGNVFPRRRLQRKPLVSDPGMHHGTCVTHVPRCMSGSLTRACGENVPDIPGACAPTVLRIWQEAHETGICAKILTFSNSQYL